jgi:hypothetical protein
MKTLNVNKFELPFNFITQKEDWANEDYLLKVTLKPDQFEKGNQKDPKTYINGILTMKYQDKEIRFRYFRYEIGRDIRFDIYQFMKYESGYFYIDTFNQENFNFFLELIERIQPTYNVMK